MQLKGDVHMKEYEKPKQRLSSLRRWMGSYINIANRLSLGNLRLLVFVVVKEVYIAGYIPFFV